MTEEEIRRIESEVRGRRHEAVVAAWVPGWVLPVLRELEKRARLHFKAEIEVAELPIANGTWCEHVVRIDVRINGVWNGLTATRDGSTDTCTYSADGVPL